MFVFALYGHMLYVCVMCFSLFLLCLVMRDCCCCVCVFTIMRCVVLLILRMFIHNQWLFNVCFSCLTCIVL